MKEQFLPYEESLALKELGFDEPCLAFFIGDKRVVVSASQEGNDNSFWKGTGYGEDYISAPLYQQAFRWFREKHRLDGHVTFPESQSYKVEGVNSIYYDIEIYRLQGGDAHKVYKFVGYSDDHHKTELACIRELIKIIKNG